MAILFKNAIFNTVYKILSPVDVEVILPGGYAIFLSDIQDEDALLGMIYRGSNLVDLIDGAEPGTLKGGGFRLNVPVTNVIPFTHIITQVGTRIVSENIILTPKTDDAKPGSRTIMEVVADGIHTVDYSSFSTTSDSVYDNTSGALHVFEFYRGADSYTCKVTRVNPATEPQPQIPFLAADFEGKNMIFKGDSITRGFNVATPYCNLLCTAKNGVKVNDGVDGMVMQGGTPYGGPVFNKTSIPVKTAGDKNLIFGLGVNDQTNAVSGFTVGGFKAKYHEVLNYAINTRGWKASDIILMTPFYMPSAAVGRALQESYAAAVREIAAMRRTILIDVYLFMRDYPGVDGMFDGLNIHPNQALTNAFAAWMGNMDYRTEYQKTFRTNWALATKAGVASASNELGPSFAFNANNGHRNTNGAWGTGTPGTGGWFSGGAVALPVWWQVDFAATKIITEINLFSLVDGATATTMDILHTTPSTIFTNKDFIIQYWTGSAWSTLITVTGSNKAWRNFKFAPVTTQKLRVTVSAVGSDSTKAAVIVEFEALGD